MDIDHLADDEVTVFLVGQLAGDTRAYARDRRRACKRMVAEIYSPPRVVKHLSRFPNEQLVPGFSLDLTCLDPSLELRTQGEEGQGVAHGTYA